jgi:hypothetical protein
MTFDGDMHQRKVKNSSFGNPKFSGGLHPIYLFFVCLKEHTRMQGITEAFSFKFLLLM